MKLPEAAPVQGELADTEPGEHGLPHEAVQLFNQLRLVAGFLREAPPGEGPRLLWRSSDGKVHVRAIAGALTIGRSADCDIVLPVPRVSRHHGHVWNQGNEIWLKDMDSTTGTRVNGQAIASKVLHDGDFLEMGGAPLVYIHGA